MKNSEDIWNNVLKELEGHFDAEGYLTWINPLYFENKKDFFIVHCQNTYLLKSFKEQHWELLQKTIEKHSGLPLANIKLNIDTGQSLEKTENSALISTLEKSNKKLTKKSSEIAETESNLNPSFTFHNFIEGSSNQLARVAAIHAAQNLGKAYNPLFIYGDVGLGKTHLMQATGSLIRQLYPKAKVLYLHSEKFIADVVKALEYKNIQQVKYFYRKIDALLIDDVQFLAGKDRSQEEFFYTFNALVEGQSQIILTSDCYPSEIRGVENRLKSRFGGGMTTAIDKPDLETRVAILQSKAKAQQIELDYEIAFAIAERFDTNVRELEGALRKIIATKNLMGSTITLDTVLEVLKDNPNKENNRKTSIEIIQLATCNFFGITLLDLLSEKRERQIARPRQIAMGLCKELTGASLPEIGKAFGGRDHTTVLHAAKKVKSLLESDAEFKEKFYQLKRKVIDK